MNHYEGSQFNGVNIFSYFSSSETLYPHSEIPMPLLLRARNFFIFLNPSPCFLHGYPSPLSSTLKKGLYSMTSRKGNMNLRDIGYRYLISLYWLLLFFGTKKGDIFHRYLSRFYFFLSKIEMRYLFRDIYKEISKGVF